MSARRAGWLVSPAFDLGLMIGPGLLSAALVPALGAAGVGPLAWLALVVGVDVAHVYATLYRTWLDPAARAARGRLLVAVPVAVAAACAALHTASAALFWTAMAYLAVFHFVRQQVGVASLYRLREGLSTRTADARIERAALYAVTLFPVIWWHVHLPRPFQWFVEGDFLTGMPRAALWPAGLATAAILTAHVAARLRSGRWSPGRDLWLLTTAAVWGGGVILARGDLAFTASNVLMHGVPYLALVAWTAGRQWARTGRGAIAPVWFRPAAAPLYLAPLLGLALLEEGLWDALAWHDNAWLFGGWDAPAWAAALAVPLLSVPQVTHYVLDGFIWKMGPQNPGLRELFESDRAPAGGP